MKKIKEIIDSVSDLLSLSSIAKLYFDRDRTWFYHKLNENIINSIPYSFTDNELDVLVMALRDVSSKINSAVGDLKEVQQAKVRQKGKYYTVSNPFNHVIFKKWYKQIPKQSKFVEPFAGNNNVTKLVCEVCEVDNWLCFDVSPTMTNVMSKCKVVKRNCVLNFPKGIDVAITNPPYLAKNSATRRKLPYPETKYDDLYKLCLDVMLSNCSYVAAIVPESFITSNLFHERLYGVISLNVKMFKDTECPVCLALFVPNKDNNDFVLYVGDEKIGMYEELKKCDFSDTRIKYKLRFNDVNGSIGVKCVDSQMFPDIRFINGEAINSNNIKNSSRTFTRIGGFPSNINIDELVSRCNTILYQYRENTKDVFLTSFKGLRQDMRYRRRITFKTLSLIINRALSEME